MGRKKSLIPLVDKKLTRRQTKFVKQIVSQDGLITNREAALRAGYPESSCHTRAYELLNPEISPHVCKAIAEYREELDRVYEVGYKRHIRALGELRNQAAANKAYSAAVMAEYRRGQAQGDIYVSKSEVRHGTIDQMDREEVMAELEKLRNDGVGPIIDVTPTVEEPEEEKAASEAHRSGVVELTEDRAEDDEPLH